MILNKYFSIIFLIIPITWAGSFIAGKYVIADIDPISSVFWRFIFSAFLMFPLLILTHRRAHPKFLDKQYVIHLLIVVLTSGIGYHLFFFWALDYTSPTNAAIIIALNPFFTAFGEIVIFKTTRPKRFYLGFLLAFTGAIWVNVSRGNGLTMPGFGELLCLIASILWSVYTLAAKATKKKEWDALWIGAYNYLLTALILLPFMANILYLNFWFNLSFEGWIGLWYMAIFPTAIGYTLFYIGVQKKGPAWAVIYIYLVPSITANLDYIFFNARFTFPMVLGTTLVVIGLFTGNINREQLNWFKTRIYTLYKK